MEREKTMRHKKVSVGIQIEGFVYIVRGQKVMLDEDLAKLYQVSTKVLVQGLKRNLVRFPQDFMFQLTTGEHEDLRSQFVTSSGRTGRRYAPYALTIYQLHLENYAATRADRSTDL